MEKQQLNFEFYYKMNLDQILVIFLLWFDKPQLVACFIIQLSYDD